MTNVTVQEALKAAIEVIEQAIPDKRGEFEEQQKLYENYPNLAYKYDYLKVEADEMQQALDKCKSALSDIEKCEPVGYLCESPDKVARIFVDKPLAIHSHTNTPLYTSPQHRDWVGLSDEVKQKLHKEHHLYIPTIELIESACKQLNTKG